MFLITKLSMILFCGSNKKCPFYITCHHHRHNCTHWKRTHKRVMLINIRVFFFILKRRGPCRRVPSNSGIRPLLTPGKLPRPSLITSLLTNQLSRWSGGDKRCGRVRAWQSAPAGSPWNSQFLVTILMF